MTGNIARRLNIPVNSMRLVSGLILAIKKVVPGFAMARSFPRSHFVWQNLESADAEGWQSFDVSQFLSTNQYVTVISLVMRGTGSGAPGFYLLDARFIGVAEDNPTNQFFVRLLYS